MNAPTAEDEPGSHGLLSSEGVRLELPIAGPVPRMLAYSVDFALVVLLMFGLTVTLLVTLPIGKSMEAWFHSLAHKLAETSQDGKPPAASVGRLTGSFIALFVIAQFVCEFGYFIFWELVTNGRSPGKALVGLRVVQRSGLSVDLKSSTLRNLLRIVDVLPANYVLGLVSMLASSSGERIGDHVAGTIVIRLDRPLAAPEIRPPSAGPPLSFTRQQLACIGPRELQLIRGALRRLDALPDDRRRVLLMEVAETLRTRLQLPEPPVNHLSFLRDLLAASERYSQAGSL